MDGKKINIFEYDNFRKFLADFYDQEKKFNPKFSFRYFSRLAGFKSSAVLKQVMSGNRNIAISSIEKFSRALKLNKTQQDFFFHLVMLNQSKSTEEKKKHADSLVATRGYRQQNPIKEGQYQYLAHWYYVALREMIATSSFREDPDWLARKLHPHLTGRDIKRAIQTLLDLKLIQRDLEGRLQVTEGDLTTPDEVMHATAAHYHREMMRLAAEAIDRIPRNDRELSAITLNLSHDEIKIIKEFIQNFRKEMAQVASKDKTPECVYQLNVQFFPLFSLASEEAK